MKTPPTPPPTGVISSSELVSSFSSAKIYLPLRACGFLLCLIVVSVSRPLIDRPNKDFQEALASFQ